MESLEQFAQRINISVLVNNSEQIFIVGGEAGDVQRLRSILINHYLHIANNIIKTESGVVKNIIDRPDISRTFAILQALTPTIQLFENSTEDFVIRGN